MSETRRILVPLDGSVRAERILPHVERLAPLLDARVTLLRVLEPSRRAEVIGSSNTTDWGLGSEKLEDARAYLEHQRAHLTQSGIEVDTVLMRGIATHAVNQAAAEMKPDLLAMTSQGRTGLARVLFGNVALSLLNRANCPLYIVRTDLDRVPDSLQRILVPLDGTDRAEAVLDHVHTWLAGSKKHCKIVLLRVVRSAYQTAVFEDVDRELKEQHLPRHLLSRLGREHTLEILHDAQSYLQKRRDDLEAKGFRAGVVAAHGRPVDAILELADRTNADLVALTNQRRTGFSSLLYGSVAAGLLPRLQHPILVVPSPPDDD